MKFVITDNNTFSNEKLGVFFYGTYQFLLEENTDGMRSYEMVFKILDEEANIFAEEPLYEIITFICTVDLKDYMSYEIEYDSTLFEEFSYYDLDAERLVQEFARDRYVELTEHLEKRLTLPKEEVYPTQFEQYGEEGEFLEFNKESAGHWCGPYSHDGKEGCKITVFRDGCLRSGQYRNELNEEAKLYTYPFRLHLSGNDDLSYSKGFNSKQSMEEELKYLRKMQPLDMWLDVQDREYIFTN
jgi:hypothetical protein